MKYEVGCYYRTQAGRTVKVIKESTEKGYEAVQCDDGDRPDAGWRYNRPGDMGRCCGSPMDFSHPGNLILRKVRPPSDA
jgi:hypothetical protein